MIECLCVNVVALRSETVVRPFLLACATKQASLVLLALTALQKLVAGNNLTPGSIAMLVGSLRILVRLSITLSSAIPVIPLFHVHRHHFNSRRLSF